MTRQKQIGLQTFDKSAEKKEIKIMTKNDRLSVLQNLMKNHIGRNNEIDQISLFTKIYGNVGNYSDLQIYYMWHKLKEDMHTLRKKSACFIASRYKNGGVWGYFVVKDMTDADYYLNRMDLTIKQCQQMKKRCIRAVEESFYKHM